MEKSCTLYSQGSWCIVETKFRVGGRFLTTLIFIIKTYINLDLRHQITLFTIEKSTGANGKCSLGFVKEKNAIKNIQCVSISPFYTESNFYKKYLNYFDQAKSPSLHKLKQILLQIALWRCENNTQSFHPGFPRWRTEVADFTKLCYFSLIVNVRTVNGTKTSGNSTGTIP